MASVVAIMIADYWLLTKGNVFVSHLYVSSHHPARHCPRNAY